MYDGVDGLRWAFLRVLAGVAGGGWVPQERRVVSTGVSVVGVMGGSGRRRFRGGGWSSW